MSLSLVPISLRQAKAFVAECHRHNDPPHAWKFGVGVALGDELVGVGVAARPARELDDGFTLAIVRVCTIGTPNACSMIYGALVRAGRALGYRRFCSYTQDGEDGASLKAAGFAPHHKVRAQGHDRPSRPRNTKANDDTPKVAWWMEVAS